MDDNLSTVKSILDLKFEITQLRIDLNVVQEQCRLLLCSSTKFHKGSKEWDFDILNKMITTNLNSIKSHTQAIEDINIHLTNIDTQYDLITKKDIIDYKSLMERWDNFDNVLAEHAQSLEALSYRVSLCDCQTLYNKVEDLAGKLNKINDSIPDFAGLTKLVNETSDQFKTSISDIDTIKTNINLINSAIDGLPDYGNSVQSLDDTLKMLTDKVNEYDGQYTDIEKKYNDLQVRFGNLDNTLTLFKCSIDEQKKKNDEQDKKIQDNNTLMCQIDTKVEALSRLVDDLQKMIVPTNLCDAWPIGSIFITIDKTSPTVLLGCGTWEQIKDVFLLSAGKISAGSTGGEEEHVLTLNELPQHSHVFTEQKKVGDTFNLTSNGNCKEVFTETTQTAAPSTPSVALDIKNIDKYITSSTYPAPSHTSSFNPVAFIPKGSKGIHLYLDGFAGAEDDFQVFTRDGYHICGTKIGDATWSSYGVISKDTMHSKIFTQANGFFPGCTYKFPGDNPDIGYSKFNGSFNNGCDRPEDFVFDGGKNIAYSRQGSSGTMHIQYSGDFDSIHDNDGNIYGGQIPRYPNYDIPGIGTEHIYIDQVTEDLLVFTSGLGSYTVWGYWDYVPTEATLGGDTDKKGDKNHCLYQTSIVGSDRPHNNMPPYLAVYMWKRVA